jgi:hypothetical protein
VLTKPDLIDEENTMSLVEGKRNPPRLGYCIVRNRGQSELTTDANTCHRKEMDFFTTEPWSKPRSCSSFRAAVSAVRASELIESRPTNSAGSYSTCQRIFKTWQTLPWMHTIFAIRHSETLLSSGLPRWQSIGWIGSRETWRNSGTPSASTRMGLRKDRPRPHQRLLAQHLDGRIREW